MSAPLLPTVPRLSVFLSVWMVVGGLSGREFWLGIDPFFWGKRYRPQRCPRAANGFECGECALENGTPRGGAFLSGGLGGARIPDDVQGVGWGAFVSQHACGTSPVVEGELVDPRGERDDQTTVPESLRSGESFIIAVDARSGETVWRTPRKSKVVAYSTPCIYETPETERLLIFNRQAHGSMRCGRSMGGWSGRLTKPLTSGV